MDLSLSDAAKAVKRSKQALALAIQKGRLSATKDAQGAWRVDSAELFRVYPPEAKPEVTGDANAIEVLRARLAALEAIREADRELVAELRDARDQWRRQAETWQRQAEQLLLALPAGMAPAAGIDAQGGQVIPSDQTPGAELAGGSQSDSSDLGHTSGHPGRTEAKKRGWFARLLGMGGGDDGE